MYKSILLFTVIIVSAWNCRAQTFSEWFAQKKTQKKYLALQIAKLQLYLGYVKKGYEIADKGLSTIGDIKDKDFKLHDLFFSDLLIAKTAVRDYTKTKQIASDAEFIRSSCNNIKSSLKDTKEYSEVEKDFIRSQLDNMLHDLLYDLATLKQVLEQGELQMKDNDRLERINKIYGAVSTKKEWIINCSKDYHLLLLQRTKNKRDLKQLNGLF